MTNLFSTVKGRGSTRAARLAIGVSMLALVCAPALALAQSDNGNTEDEIIVTAAKRGGQALHDVPIPVQAISGDELKARGAEDFADYAASVPGLRYEDLGPGDKRIFLRGINSIGASTAGVYFDEAVVTGSNKEDGGGRSVDIKLYDLDHVEVLKGPQGTLYGASSMSGTIKMIPKKPNTQKYEAYVDSRIGGTAHGGTDWGVNGMVNMPLVQDKAALRVVGWNDDDSGYIDNVRLGTKNINNNHTWGGRAMLRLTPTDRFTVDLSAMHQNTHSNGTSRETPAGFTGALPTPALPTFFGGDYLTTSYTKDEWNDNWEIYSGTGEYRMDNGTITATSNWFTRKIDFNFDSTPILIFFGVPIPAITHQPQKRRIWSNELRYASDWNGPLQVVIGGLVQREKTNFEVQVIASDPVTGLALGPFDPNTDALAGTGNAFFGRTNDGTINQEALFGETSLEITQKLTATVGLRYFHSKQKSSELQTHPFGGFPNANRPPPAPNSDSNNKITTKFNLSYKADENLLVFATASQGFRVGGLNAASLPLIAGVPRNFGPDSLWNYELGVKNAIADNRILFDLSAFWIDWKNMQTVSKDATGAFQFIANAGKARIKGIEFSTTARVTDQFDLSGGFAYSHANLVQDQPGVTPGNVIEVTFPGHKGDRIPNVPKYTFNASAQYTVPMAGDMNGIARIDYTYVGHYKTEFRPQGTGPSDNPFTQRVGGYNTVNGKIGVEKDLWSANVFVKNIFDERGIVDAIASDQDPLAYLLIRPRTFGLNVTVRMP